MSSRIRTFLMIVCLSFIAGGVVVYVSSDETIQAGQTVTDPGSAPYTFYGVTMAGDGWVTPINWSEVYESDRAAGALSPSSYGVRFGLTSCFRVMGAEMTALEQFEDEVLVRYSSSSSARTDYEVTCPNGVMFWVSVEDFKSADARYKEFQEARAEGERVERQRQEKERRKAEIGKKYMKSATRVQALPKMPADRPRRGPTVPKPSNV